jgi:hypothetical protein
MLIPTGTIHKHAVTGAGIKEVACQYCSGRFFYIIHRTGKGRATAPLFIGQKAAAHQAEAQAYATTRWLLHATVDPVPCLYCGHLQPDMVYAAKHRLFNPAWWLFAAAIATSSPVIVWYLLFGENNANPSNAVLIACGVLGGLVVASFFLGWLLYNPDKGATMKKGSAFPGRYSSEADARAALDRVA